MLPTILTENTHFYKGNEKKLKKFLGKPYISYSSVSSYIDYQEDFIKQKFAKIKLPDGLYAALGTFVGQAIETGSFNVENPNGFSGLENLDLKKLRPKGAEYEKLITIDMGDYFIVGFIDIFTFDKKTGVAMVSDCKSGGSSKEDSYKSKEYIQTTLYAKAIQDEYGTKCKEVKTKILFIRREGSHINPPLHISKEQFEIPLEYNEERVKYALDKVDNAVKGISKLYEVYTRVFEAKK